MQLPVHTPITEENAARLRVVEEHLRCENAHDLAGIMATFGDEAEYHDTSWAEHHNGRAAVQSYYLDALSALPDMRIDMQNCLVTDEAVVLEVSINGTHLGPWRGLPATGRTVQFSLCGIFRFSSNGKLASETIYYDRASVMRQIGLYHEPIGMMGRLATALSHPMTVALAFARKLRRRDDRSLK